MGKLHRAERGSSRQGDGPVHHERGMRQHHVPLRAEKGLAQQHEQLAGTVAEGEPVFGDAQPLGEQVRATRCMPRPDSD